MADDVDLSEFELFTKESGQPLKPAWVTVQRSGYLSFNQATYMLLGAPSRVDILYNPNQQIVALRAASADSKTAALVRLQAGSKSYIISIRAFANRYTLAFDKSTRYAVEKLGDLVLIRLGVGGTPVAASRTKRTLSDNG